MFIMRNTSNYETLGVPIGARRDDIKLAFRCARALVQINSRINSHGGCTCLWFQLLGMWETAYASLADGTKDRSMEWRAARTDAGNLNFVLRIRSSPQSGTPTFGKSSQTIFMVVQIVHHVLNELNCDKGDPSVREDRPERWSALPM